MPDLVMHHHFARVVYSALSDEAKKSINNMGLYDFASAGPDAFSLIKFFNREKNAEYLKIKDMLHSKHTRQFLVELAKLTKLNKDLFPYLCGYISHYYLDIKTNPYIYYKTGLYDIDVFNTVKNRGLKMKLERAMDSYVIENYYSVKPNKFKIHKKILYLNKIPKTIQRDLDVLFSSVYSINDGYKKVNKSLKSSKFFYRCIYDPFGLKTKVFDKLDNGKSDVDLHYITYYNKGLNTRVFDIFNFKHERWYNPVKKEISSIDSFFNLFDKAKELALECIETLYNYVFLDEDVNLDFYFANVNYKTGLDCNQNNEMVYFNNIFTNTK